MIEYHQYRGWYSRIMIKIRAFTNQLIESFEYLIFKINKIVSMATAIEFAMSIIKSFIPTP
jgi:hypothetical protein